MRQTLAVSLLLTASAHAGDVSLRDICRSDGCFSEVRGHEPCSGHLGILATGIYDGLSGRDYENVKYYTLDSLYSESVSEESRNRTRKLEAHMNEFSDSYPVVGGYSEGAHAVHDIPGRYGNRDCTRDSIEGSDVTLRLADEIAASTVFEDTRRSERQSYNVRMNADRDMLSSAPLRPLSKKGIETTAESADEEGATRESDACDTNETTPPSQSNPSAKSPTSPSEEASSIQTNSTANHSSHDSPVSEAASAASGTTLANAVVTRNSQLGAVLFLIGALLTI